MKKIFSFLISAAVILGAVSCAKENVSEITPVGEEITSTFSVTLADLGTRVAGDADIIDRVAYGIYDVNDNGRFLSTISSTDLGPVEFKNDKATIDVRLFTGKVYDLVFFAYSSKNNAYSIDWENRVLNVSYKDPNDNTKGDLANLENRDAFFHVEPDFVAGPSKTFTLRRPFAQLNAGQSQDDYNNMQRTGNSIVKSALKTQAYTQMDLGRDTYGNVLGNKVDVVFEMNNVIDLDNDTKNDELKVALKDANGNAVDTYFKHLSMNYLLVKEEELVTVDFTLQGDEGTDFKRSYSMVPLKRNHRTNIIGQLISDEAQFTILVDPIFAPEDYNREPVTYNVNTTEELTAALTANDENIIVNLNKDLTYNISSWNAAAMGGVDTKQITINGQATRTSAEEKKLITLTFVHDDGDWSHVTTNGAKLVINNVKLTNAGYNNGPWNRHDLNFACEVELNNVIADKAIALKSSGTLNNVTICDEHVDNSDAYAIWIQPNGQTVTLDGCTIVAHSSKSGDRGIKIDNEYVSDAKKVVLNVSNTSFTTQKKAAILVDSPAGAEINLKNIDISKVAADSVNAVWVDSDAVDYADLVVVNGGSKAIEDHEVVAEGLIKDINNKKYFVYSAAGLVNFAKQVNEQGVTFEGYTVELKGNIDLNKVDWEPIGQTGKTEFKGVFDGKDFTISNLAIDSATETGEHYSSALFGWLEGQGGYDKAIILKNVTIDGATVMGHHNCGALAGYTTGSVIVENCHVKNAAITCTHATDDADGDKAGALIGNGTAEPEVIQNCTAADCTVNAGRDAGQVVGACKESKVVNCSATNVVVTANGTSTGNNVRNEVIGRLL